MWITYLSKSFNARSMLEIDGIWMKEVVVGLVRFGLLSAIRLIERRI